MLNVHLKGETEVEKNHIRNHLHELNMAMMDFRM